ncbi:translation initiation factor IF-2-like [Ailuropoda melanoleuca]|uniref:translation initiation factor IF-2-like n=1 Tax=Ailuropoda melanoleuca TaxID=9646 RepID=UPI0014950099|nr:translation initiation factor IF-2-like [Ailuropoda melanoleuca]
MAEGIRPQQPRRQSVALGWGGGRGGRGAARPGGPRAARELSSGAGWPTRSAASREEGGGREEGAGGGGGRRRAEEGGALRGYLWFALIPRGNLKLSHSWHSSRLRRGPTLGLRAGARTARASAPQPSAHLRRRAEPSRAGPGRRV